MILEVATVVEHRHFVASKAESFHILKLRSPEIAVQAMPGQFVMLRVNELFDPLLRRPFSIFHTEKDCLYLFYKVVGKGTSLMSQWSQGREVSLLGPLGNGFGLPSKDVPWLVAGGAGIAPLFFLHHYLKHHGYRPKILWGLRYRISQELIDFLSKYLDNIVIYTEDGSLGYQGLVTEGVEKLYQITKPSKIYACGPIPMLKSVYDWLKNKDIPMEVSLEAQMACGIGACLGCIIKGKEGYKKVCCEGPVFDAREIKWDEI